MSQNGNCTLGVHLGSPNYEWASVQELRLWLPQHKTPKSLQCGYCVLIMNCFMLSFITFINKGIAYDHINNVIELAAEGRKPLCLVSDDLEVFLVIRNFVSS